MKCTRGGIIKISLNGRGSGGGGGVFLGHCLNN